MSLQSLAEALCESVEVELAWLQEHEPERLQRSGFQHRIALCRDLRAEFRRLAAGLADPDEDAAGFAQGDATATARHASYEVCPRSGTHRRLVLDAMVEAGSAGRTYDELVDATGLGTYDRVGPRARELREGGWIEDSGRTRGSALGQESIVWVLTAVARERLREPIAVAL